MKIRKTTLAFAGLICCAAVFLLLVALLVRFGGQTFHWKIIASGRTDHELAFRIKAGEKPSRALRALLSDPACPLHHIELDWGTHCVDLEMQCRIPITQPALMRIRHLVRRRKRLPNLVFIACAGRVRIWDGYTSTGAGTEYFAECPSLGLRRTRHPEFADAKQEAFDMLAKVVDDAQLCLDRHLSQTGPNYRLRGNLQSDSGLTVQVRPTMK
jgi:hypothetical protein